MKKLLALLLAVMMTLALASCSKTATTTESTATKTDDTAATETTEEAAGYTGEELAFDFTTTYQQTETGGDLIQHFADKLSELTDGKVTVNILWGGTVYNSAAELEAVSSGAVQMCSLGHMPHADKLPLLCTIPSFAPESCENAVGLFNDIIFDNAETSKLISDEATANNIKYLNVLAGGANAFCAKYAFTDLASLVAGSQNFGNFDAVPFKAIGFTNITSLIPPDIYDALDRGIIDATQMGLAPMIAMSWNEVAPNFMLDDTFAAGNFFTVNLDWWNSLSAEQQAVIQEASDDTETYSTTAMEESITASVDQLKADGTTVVEMSDADAQKWFATLFDANAESKLASTTDKDATTAILTESAAFTKVDWTPAA